MSYFRGVVKGVGVKGPEETVTNAMDPQTPRSKNHPFDEMSNTEKGALAESVMVITLHRRGEGVNPGICTHYGHWAVNGVKHGTVEDPFGGFIELTRAGVLHLFRETVADNPEIKYLVMIDNDQRISAEGPLRLAAWDKPMVSGVVCGFSPDRGIFACFTIKDDNGVGRFPSLRETKVMPATGLVEASHVGTGYLCLRRDLIENVMEATDPFFVPEDIRRESLRMGNLRKSEDIVFAEQCSALGYTPYVDLSVHALHEKTIALGWPESQIDPSLDAGDWKASVFDYKG